MTTFSDDFARPDSTDLGAGWVEVSGDWSIVSGQLATGNTGGTIVLRAAAAMATDDNSAQVTIATPTTASMGVWCRGNAGITSGYLWRNDGGSWDLFSVVGGTFNIIGTYAAAAAPGDVAKVQAVGSTIKGFVNGVQRVSVTNAAVATGTSVGIRSMSVGSIRYDDFTGADVTAGAALGAAVEIDAARPLSATKTFTLGTALEADIAQPLTGAKSAVLGPAAAVEAAQPITGSKRATLTPAATVEQAQPLTGRKAAALGTAVEIDTARPLTVAGEILDIDVTVGVPYSPWTVATPEASDWQVGAPR